MNTPKQRKKAVRKVINVRRIMNPFDPLRDIREEQWAWKKGRSLADYLPLGTTDDYVVSHNGGIVTSERFAMVSVKPDDFIVLCPVPRGGQGGGGKMLLRIVGMIVIAVASYFTAGAASAAYGAAAGAAAGAATSIAGSLLLNALLPPPVATNGNTNSGLASSATYGADGAKNTSEEDIPVPLTFGNFRQAGNIVGIHTENDGNNQVLYMLINAGEGPIASISDVQINGRSLAEFSEASIQTRLGDPAQPLIDWFSQTLVPYSKGQLLPADNSYLTFATVTDVEQVRVDLTFPNGLFSANKNSGALENNSVAVEAEYCLQGTNQWVGFSTQQPAYYSVIVIPVADVDPNHSDAQLTPYSIIKSISVVDRVKLTPVATDVAALVAPQYWDYINRPFSTWPVQPERGRETVPGSYNVYTTVTRAGAESALICTDNSRSTVRRSFLSPRLPVGKYQIRVRRNDHYVDYAANNGKSKAVNTNLDATAAMSDCYVSDLNEITFDGVAYNHTALLALRIKLDAQLSGVPSVTFMHGGKLVTVMNRSNGALTQSQAASQNPAWITWDLLTDTRWGGGIDPARLDLDSFLDWAAYCDAQGLTFNGVLDTVMNLWDAASYVSACGHAQLLSIGTRYYIAIERASDPVMMFGMGNIVEDSFKQSWMGRTDRATEIDVTFFDQTDNYKQKTVKVTDSSLALEGAKQNVSAITAYGVVDIQRAYREGAFRLNLNRYLTQTCEWQSPIEAIACTGGDVVLLQHDMPAWATSGRTAAGSTSSVIQLDKTVTMEAGKQYKLLILNNFVRRSSSAITQIVGNFLKLSNGVNMNTRVRRVCKSGIDVGITSAVPDGVYVDSITGLSVGDMVDLLDTDVVVENDVAFNEGDHDSVRLIAPLDFVPEPFVNYMFGEIAKVKKAFRINQITLGSTDMTRTIRALEYRPEVYDLSSYGDVMTTLTPPMLDPRQAAIGVVQNLAVYEETFVSGSQILTDVRATWAQPMVGSYAGADIYVQINGGATTKVATVRADTNFIVPGVSKGDYVVVRVVAFDIWGKYADYSQSPTAGYTIVGNVTNISVAAVTGADFIWAGRDCKLYWNYNSLTASFEFGSEPDGAQGARDPHFMDYEVRIYDTSSPRKLLRTDHTTDNSYIYTYEKNFADGLHRRLTFEIAVRDTFGNIGHPAVIEAYNPPPVATTAGVTAAFDRATIQYTHSDDPDFAGAMFYLSDVSPVLLQPINVAYDGPDSAVLLSNLMFNHDYYCVIAPYDAFGKDELIPTNEFHFKTPFMDVAAIADGVLKDSQLTPGLQQRIDLIDAPASTIGSVAQRLADAAATAAGASAAAMAAEASARQIADNALTASISTESQTRQTADSSLSSQITTVSGRVDSNAAAIQTEQTARVSADSSLSTRIDTVVATSNTNTAAITSESTARTNADSALSTRIDAVVATNATNSAAITTETNARVAADSANASSITALQAQFGNTLALRVEARGGSAVGAPADGLFNAVSGAKLASDGRSFNVATVDATGKVTLLGVYDTFGSTAARDSLVSALNALTGAVTVIVWTFDEPQTNLAGTLQAALVRCGATNAVLSQMKYRGAYILVGVPGCGEGGGTERYAGAVASDSAAFVSYSFQVLNGKPMASDGGQVAAIVQANVTSEASARASADSALGTRIDTLTATVNGNAAIVTSEQTVRANADTALGTRIDTVSASTAANAAAITTETNARTAADSALSTQINTVAAAYGLDATNLCANPVAASNSTTGWTTATAVGGTTGDVPLGAPAANVFRQNIRDNLYTTRTVPVSGGQQHYVEMQVATPVAAANIGIGLHLTGPNMSDAWIAGATLGATSSWTRISGLVTIPAGYTTAQLWTVIDIAGGVNNDKARWYFTDIEWRPANQTQPVMAAVTSETTARAAADSALSTRIDTLSSSVSNNSALIQTEQTARASGDAANASSISTLQTTVNGNTASIQAQSSSINGLSAQYTVKIDNNGYVSGYGLASYAVNGGIVSEFAVRADTFSVQLPGYSGVRPFTIGAVYGVPRVIISNALIGDGSIDNAKIGDAQVNTAKITDGSITTAKIGYAAIQTAHIGEAQIDTARIGANAVSTLAAWGGMVNNSAVGYWSSGGMLAIFVSGYGSAAFDGTTFAQVGSANKNGTTTYLTPTCLMWLTQPGAGYHVISTGSFNAFQTATGMTVSVFEFKR